MRTLLVVLLLSGAAYGQAADAPILIRPPELAPRRSLLSDIYLLRRDRQEMSIVSPIVFASAGGVVCLASVLALSAPRTYGESTGSLLAAVGVPTLLVSSIVLFVRLANRSAIDERLSLLEYEAAAQGLLVPEER